MDKRAKKVSGSMIGFLKHQGDNNFRKQRSRNLAACQREIGVLRLCSFIQWNRALIPKRPEICVCGEGEVSRRCDRGELRWS